MSPAEVGDVVVAYAPKVEIRCPIAREVELLK